MLTFDSGGGEHLVELRQVRQDGEAVGHGAFDHVLWIEQRRNAQVLFGNREGQLVVLVDVERRQAGEIAVI